jgi:type IV secretory pathway VirB4 component
MGGDWHDLGGSLSAGSEHSVSLQPLARIDDQPERAWAAEWVVAILAKEGVAIDPTAKEHVWSALTSLASSPVNERTITGLAVLLQSTALKQALQPSTALPAGYSTPRPNSSAPLRCRPSRARA